jgi:hypothetical protein
MAAVLEPHSDFSAMPEVPEGCFTAPLLVLADFGRAASGRQG